MNEKQQKILSQMIQAVRGDIIDNEELSQVIEVILDLIKTVKENIDSLSKEYKSENVSLTNDIKYSLNELELSTKNLINSSEKNNLSKIRELSQRFNEEISRIESIMPIPQLFTDFSSDISKLYELVKNIDNKQIIIPPQDNGEMIVDKINQLSIFDDSLKIDQEHIKGLKKDLEDLRFNITSRSHAFVGGGVTRVYHDSTLSGNGTQESPLSVIGGGTAGYQVPTGTVNGTNQTFVFALAPNVIVSDGVVFNKTQSDGTVMWTGTTIVTLVIAPNQNIFSIA